MPNNNLPSFVSQRRTAPQPPALDPVSMAIINATTKTPAQNKVEARQAILSNPQNRYNPPPSIKTAKINFGNMGPGQKYDFAGRVQAKQQVQQAAQNRQTNIPNVPQPPQPSGPTPMAGQQDPSKIISAMGSAVQKILGGNNG